MAIRWPSGSPGVPVKLHASIRQTVLRDGRRSYGRSADKVPAASIWQTVPVPALVSLESCGVCLPSCTRGESSFGTSNATRPRSLGRNERFCQAGLTRRLPHQPHLRGSFASGRSDYPSSQTHGDHSSADPHFRRSKSCASNRSLCQGCVYSVAVLVG